MRQNFQGLLVSCATGDGSDVMRIRCALSVCSA